MELLLFVSLPQTAPNIVLIVSDDQGFANIGYHNSTVLTPRIDALAHEGLTLEGYYVQPVCSPTRSSLMTGRYTYRLGTQATVIRSDVPFGVPLKETFISQNMKDANYETALFGKWHLGFHQRVYTPLARGFDEHLGYFEGCIDYYTHHGGGFSNTQGGTDWHRGNETTCFADSGNYTAELIVPETLAYLAKHSGARNAKPFFLYLPFHLIHGPNQVPAKYLELYPALNLSAPASALGMCGVCLCANPDGDDVPASPVGFGEGRDNGLGHGVPLQSGRDATWKDCRTVLAMAAALDWAVGAVVDGLKSHSGMYENTLVVYTSDNGAQQGQGGTSYPLRGFKTQLYEGGMRVPGFVSGGWSGLPASVRGTVSHKLYHVTDWLPTLTHIAGGTTTRNQPLDGINIWESLINLEKASPRTEILHNINPACGFGYVNPNAGVRVGDYKLLVECFNTSTLNATGKIELYNVISDPYEKTDVSGTNPEKVASLLLRLKDYASSADQVPPTIFFPFAEQYNRTVPSTGESVLAVAPWNYQCPQCRHGGALPGNSPIPNEFRLDPWCDDVTCGVGPPAPTPTPAPAPRPTPSCPASKFTLVTGGMGGNSNKDIAVLAAASWGACCTLCMAWSNAAAAAAAVQCKGWTFFTDAKVCHLHANTKDLNPEVANRITGLGVVGRA